MPQAILAKTSLGGSTNAATAFDVSNIVAVLPAIYSSTQYVGFSQFQKTGTSSWTLTGTGNAAMQWTIKQGTLRGDATALAGNIPFAPTAGNSAAVVFDQGSGNANSPASAGYAGVISGDGSLRKTGDGSLTLTGNNSYSGGTTISAGTLQIGDGGTSGSISGDVVNNGILIFDRSDASSLAGAISGSGSLIKRGAGVLAITGNNNYSGNTSVSAGTLQFDSFNQNTSQTLGIGARSNADYGKLAVTGTATFAADAKIAVDVASINTLASGQTLTSVISAGTLDASTFDVTDNSTLFNFRAQLSGNAVDLFTLSTSSGIYDAVVANGADSTSGAARVLDRIMTGAPANMADIITALGKLGTQHEVSQAVAQTVPLLSGGVSQNTLGMLSSFNNVVQGRLGSVSGTGMQGASGQSGLSGGDGLDTFANRQAWAKAFGSLANQHDADGASGFSSQSWGMAFGADGELDRDTRIGIAYAYANSSVTGNTALSGTRQHANIDSHLLALYGSRALKDDLQLDWQADIGRNGIDGSRQIGFGGLNRTAESSHASYSAHVGAGLSKQFVLNATTTVAPSIRADYTWLRDDSYRESGAGSLNLDVDSNTTEAFVLMAEGRIRHALSERSQLDANLGIGYDLVNDRSSIVSTYAGAPGQSFATRGIDQSPWIVSGGIGYTMQANRNTQITLRYDAEGRDDYLNQTASVKANWAF